MSSSKKMLSFMMSCALALCSAGAASPATSVAISEDSPSVTYDNTNKTESKASEEPFQVFDIYDAYSAVMATTTTTTVPAYTTTTCTVATTDHKPGELKNGPLNGIDVSEHQGVIDWAKVKKTGKVDFAIVRAGYGRETYQRDKQFDVNMVNAQANCIPCGVYWFSYALSPEEALIEAETCYSIIKDYNYQMPVYFDIETDAQWGLTAATCSAMAEVFCQYMKDKGYTPGIYSCASFLETKIYSTVRQKYQIWVAEYGHSVDHYTGGFSIWQHSDVGVLDGITEYVDLNYAYVNLPELLGTQMCAVDVKKPKAKGIDVFEGSGEIDWSAVKKAGYSFGIVRAGSGYDMKAPDKLFEKNMKGAKEAGIECGAYWQLKSVTADGARKEAEQFYNFIKDQKFEYPVYLDLTDPAVTKAGLTSSKVTELVNAFCTTVENHEYFVGVRASEDFLKNKVDPSLSRRYDIWLVNQTASPSYTYNFGIWQNSSVKVSGVSGLVATDNAYRVYSNTIISKKLNGY